MKRTICGFLLGFAFGIVVATRNNPPVANSPLNKVLRKPVQVQAAKIPEKQPGKQMTELGIQSASQIATVAVADAAPLSSQDVEAEAPPAPAAHVYLDLSEEQVSALAHPRKTV